MDDVAGAASCREEDLCQVLEFASSCFKIDWASLMVGRKFTVFAFFLTLYLRAIFQHKSLGGLYLEGRIHGGAYFGSLRYTRLEAVVRTISTGRFVSIYFSIRRKEKFSSTDKFITKISWTLFFDP